VKRPIEHLPAAALTACVLGLLSSPIVYVATGALSDLSPVFSFVMLPPFLLAAGFLLSRYLAGSAEPSGRRGVLALLEVAAWLAVAMFLFFVSGVHLMRGLERVGAACAASIGAAIVWLPVAVLRRTALERRLARLSKAAAITALLLFVGAAGAAAIAYLVTPPAFI
jgi:hypothetical protein